MDQLSDVSTSDSHSHGSAVSNDLSELFCRDLARLATEIAAFPEGSSLLWQVAPGVNNSAGNLTLHLEGNLREFIGRQLGNFSYSRQRELEFTTRGISSVELVLRIREVSTLVSNSLSKLTERSLSEEYPEEVFNAPMSTRFFLIHLYGHLSFHLGQVSYLRRILLTPH